MAVSPTSNVNALDVLTYTMTIGNVGTQTLGDPASGNGITVAAAIPSVTTYVTGSLTTAAGFNVQWTSDNETTWVDSEPAIPSTVTDVRWVLTSAVAASTANAVNDTLQVVIKSGVGDGATISNTAIMGFGAVTSAATDGASTTVAQSALTSANVQPESLAAGTVGDVDVTFVVTNPLPVDGKIVVTFPSTFVISSGGATAIGGDGTSFSGPSSVGIAGQIVTITRSGGSEVVEGATVTLELTNIKNNTVTGSTGTTIGPNQAATITIVVTAK